jgi:hypothetical protein
MMFDFLNNGYRIQGKNGICAGRRAKNPPCVGQTAILMAVCFFIKAPSVAK